MRKKTKTNEETYENSYLSQASKQIECNLSSLLEVKSLDTCQMTVPRRINTASDVR